MRVIEDHYGAIILLNNMGTTREKALVEQWAGRMGMMTAWRKSLMVGGSLLTTKTTRRGSCRVEAP
ncbi:hypothetical protein AXF42_Ash004556 [Apostasia shenzhenica]|uniref:Uncharacterized protein n=1 Tax=Apostasia shenzhenica TaxID=1088818 RepID=A0A2I0BGZ5_9ASPA|nr:hypothetical protein AXF42_Ash004556 [Apostasia shenzhenica]